MAQLLSALPVGALVKDTGTVYNGESPIFRVLEHGHNGDPSNSTTLEFRDIITLRCFDAKESTNPNSERATDGNNRYLYSNILQWLNSNASAGNWYTAQHAYDAIPSQQNVNDDQVVGNAYDSDAGFLTYLSNSLRSALLTCTKISRLTNVDGGTYENVSSKIFLLSRSEIGLEGSSEGGLYSYYNNSSVQSRRIKNIATSAAIGNVTGATVGSPYSYFTRSANYAYSFVTDIVTATGEESLMMEAPCITSNGISPAFCISSNILVSDSPDSSGVYTIVWNTSAEKIISLEGLDTFKDCMENVIDDKIENIPTATTSANGLMSSTDKTKLEGIGTISSTYIDNLFT